MKLASLSPVALALALALPAAACTADDDDIDQELLSTYRAALPSKAQLSATAPQATAAYKTGDPALYPHSSWDIVEGINGSIGNMIDLLELIVATPPTFYNSDTLEFVWGPWPNDDGIGYVAAYIKDAGSGEDFRYHYAFLRGATNDLATLTPVIWGGANPDPVNDDHGVGVTLWDFEANYAFEQANDPAFDAEAAATRGRFASIYGADDDEADPDNELAFVVAVFRDFVPEDNPTAEPADLDYFYGRYITSAHTIDFLDYQVAFDISEPADAIAEDVGVRMAFLDEGVGRAEADVANGSFALNQSARAVECWDESILQTYLLFEVLDGADVVDSSADGVLSDCGLFAASLDDLDIPALEDIDAELLAALDQVATTGVPAE